MVEAHTEIIRLIRNNPQAIKALTEALELEDTNESKREYGWEWHETHSSPALLNNLVTQGILDVAIKTNSGTSYKLHDRIEVSHALLLLRNVIYPSEEREHELPPDLFSPVLLHEGKKQLLLQALTSSKPVHCLLVGDIASGKTIFLQELSRLPNAEYILGSRLSTSGLYDLMFEKTPKYLILDELDKLQSQDNVSALLSLMETGILSEAKHKRRRQSQFTTWVFAGANYLERIPEEIVSRFGAYILRFRQYTSDEYLEVATNVLVKREQVEEALAKYIAEQSLHKMHTKDVRVARSLARTASSKEDIDKTLSLLLKEQFPDVHSIP